MVTETTNAFGEGRGCWATYYPDRSGMAIFASEVDALRYAVGNSMQVFFWAYGLDLSEAVRHQPPRD